MELASEDRQISEKNLAFSEDGKNVFYYTRHCKDLLHNSNESGKYSNVISWTSKDPTLTNYPTGQEFERDLLSVVNLQSSKFVSVKLEHEYHEVVDFIHHYVNNLVLDVANQAAGQNDYRWLASARPAIYLLSTHDSSKKLVQKNLIVPLKALGLCPGGNYVFWFDRMKRNWFTYEVRTGISRNISNNIPFALSINYGEEAIYPPAAGIAGWMEDESAVLVYDAYDIWKIDPRNEKKPINITQFYGRKYHRLLRFLNFKNQSIDQRTFRPSDTLVLYVFDTQSKLNGLAKLTIGKNGKLFDINMYRMRYYFSDDRYTPGFEMDPYGSVALKAKNNNVYLFRPSSPRVYPNVCISRDLIQFKRLTDFAPEKKYLWYTSQFIRWNQPNGISNEGILYNPEHFDPQKKYPLIVFIYERFSDAYYSFLKPRLSTGDINIPWYVSRGYIVLRQTFATA